TGGPGGISVAHGALELDGPVYAGGPLSVSPGTVLTGTGSGGKLANGGTVAPGNATSPLGTLTVYQCTINATGNFAFTADGASGTSSKLVVTDYAGITYNTASVNFVTAPSPGQTYTLLTAASMSGPFSSVTVTGLPDLLDYDVAYSATA